jgi:hypothetical protein
LDAWRKSWTPLDEIIRKNIHGRPSESTDFRLPTVRNQQVISSSLIAGSKIQQSQGARLDGLARRNAMALLTGRSAG